MHFALEAAHLTVQILDLLEKLLSGVGRTRRQEIDTLAEEGPATHAEEIAHLEIVEGVLGQGGMNAILELRALPDEDHSSAGQVALVAQLAGRNPDGRQRAVALELRTPEEREEFTTLFSHFFALVFTSNAQFGQAERFDFLGGSIDVESAVVRSTALMRGGDERHVTYRMRLHGNRWKVYAFDVDGMNLIENYGAQFQQIITGRTET